MTRNFPRFILFTLLASQVLLFSCRHKVVTPDPLASLQAPLAMRNKNIELLFVQENHRLPAHIFYKKEDRYAFLRGQTNTPFKIDMVINPLMRNATMVARVEKKGKVDREFVAKKTATSILSEKKSTWTPARSKLALVIPYVQDNEEVIVTTTYEWMDIRWLAPILLQEDDIPTFESRLTVDIPYGITMHFKAAKDRYRYEFVPVSFPQEKSIWVQDDNRAGLGMRYVWHAHHDNLSANYKRSHLLQMLLSFESPSQNDAGQRFDSWASVAAYIYNRIDRYDMPSAEIRALATKLTNHAISDDDKITSILAFLTEQIEKRATIGSLQEQDMQPATRTLARRFGTPADISILGKSLLMSAGIEADLIAAADQRFNPSLPDFYSPALFSSIILAINGKKKTQFFDPEATNIPIDQLAPHRQGQQALLLRAKNGTNFSLPYDSAQKNVRTYSYQMWLNEDGVLEGEYSIDLMGLDAQNARTLGIEKLRTMSMAELEAQLYGSSRTDFSIETAETINEGAYHSIRVAGFLKPQFVAKNAHGGFDLKLEKIIEPAFLALSQAYQKGFSATTKISLFIGLPPNYVVNNAPMNQQISLGGIDGRFFVEKGSGQLIVEGIAMVSLPLRNEFAQKLEPELKNLRIFGDQKIAIHHVDLAVGAQGDQPKSSAENP